MSERGGIGVDGPITHGTTTGKGMLWAPAFVASAVVGATAYVAAFDPATAAGHFPLCPFKAATGLDCPGCGGLRSVHALAHGDLAGALDQNAFVVLVVLPTAVVLWWRWVARLWRDEPAVSTNSRVGRALPYAFLVAMLVFTIVRNFPAVPFLRSGIG